MDDEEMRETYAHFKNYYQFTSACRPKYLTSLILELSTYLGRRPSPSPLLSPDVLADVDVVDLKLSINVPRMVHFTLIKYYKIYFFFNRGDQGW